MAKVLELDKFCILIAFTLPSIKPEENAEWYIPNLEKVRRVGFKKPWLVELASSPNNRITENPDFIIKGNKEYGRQADDLLKFMEKPTN